MQTQSYPKADPGCKVAVFRWPIDITETRETMQPESFSRKSSRIRSSFVAWGTSLLKPNISHAWNQIFTCSVNSRPEKAGSHTTIMLRIDENSFAVIVFKERTRQLVFFFDVGRQLQLLYCSLGVQPLFEPRYLTMWWNVYSIAVN